MSGIRALFFDVFGTLVDWRGSIAREVRRLGLGVDGEAFADAWRGEYQPAMQAVRSGGRGFVRLDVLHREILDGILELYVEHQLSDYEFISRGYEETTVRWVQRRVDLNEWKRHQAAPGLRVTSKAFGMGRRMPIVQQFA